MVSELATEAFAEAAAAAAAAADDDDATTDANAPAQGKALSVGKVKYDQAFL